MRQSLDRLLFGLVLAVTGSVALSATVGDLYTAEVMVQSQAQEERNAGMRSALAAVLVKLTGTRQSAALPEMSEAFENASRFAAQYRYRELSKAADGAPPPAPYALSVGFDKKALDRLLEQLALPAWGNTRPQVLVWLAVQESASRRFLVEPELYPQFRDAVIARAKDRGIPVAFPLFDLEDQRGVQLNDIWGNFSDNILRASQRYRADAVLVGRVHQDDLSRWVGRWTLYQNGTGVSWDVVSQSLGVAVADGVERTADTLAQRFAQSAGGAVQQRVTVALVDVADIGQYGRALNYLSGLDVVKLVQVTAVNAQQVVLDVAVKGNADTLRQVVGLGSVLHEAPAVPSSSETLSTTTFEPEVFYRVLP
jgi:hypothetical protein